jgi:S1-C subfamily serine protease
MLLPLFSASAQPVQEALLRARPAVALLMIEVTAQVTTDCGGGALVTAPATPFRDTGTGWFVHPSGWLVTSAHVIRSAQDPGGLEPMLRATGVKAACLGALLERRGLRPGERPDVEDEIARRLAARAEPGARLKIDRSIVAVLPTGTRLPARVLKYSPPVGGAAMSGRDLALLKVEATDVPTLPLGDSAQAKLGDGLHVIGFPNVVTSHELLRTRARAEPSVTSGTVSGFKEDVNGQPVIQTDAAAAGGDSGGPAVNDRGQVIGVMTFVSRVDGTGDIVQGFNFIIPAASVREFLRDSGATIGEPGAFTRAWWEGLAAFFAGHHFVARARFEEANRVLPNVPDVQRLIRENEERIATRPFPWRKAGTILTVFGAMGCAAAWGLLWRRNRFRVRPREVARLLDHGEASPVILDVRDSATYGKSPVRIPHALHVPAEQLASASTLPVETSRAVIAYCT